MVTNNVEVVDSMKKCEKISMKKFNLDLFNNKVIYELPY